MWRLRRLFAKLCALVAPERAERELAREVESHLALMEDEFQKRGMQVDEARAAARRAYGGVEQVKELHREERTFVWLEQTMQDLRYAFRSLWKDPGFTLLAVITLTLGIGINATLFSAYNAVALKPLPVSGPNEVVRLERWFQSGSRGDIQYAFSRAEYESFRTHNRAFSSMVAASWPRPVIEDTPVANRGGTITGQLVSTNYFHDLGIGTRIGRIFTFDLDTSPEIVISSGFWKRRFQSDPNVVGQLIKIKGTAFTVIGVTPEEFTGTSTTPQPPDFWAPLSLEAKVIPGAKELPVQVLARIKPSVLLQRAQAEANLLIQQVAKPDQRDKTTAISLQHTALFGNTEDIRFKALVFALMLIVGMVLMVACANVANMLLARCAGRQREIGVRLALGASRARVVRQFLTESFLLAVLGGTAGLLASVWCTRLLWSSIVQNFLGSFGGGAAFQANLDPDARVLAYAMALSLLTAVVFGLSPALQFSRPDLTTTLKEEGSAWGLRLSRSRMRAFLVAAQAMVSIVLLISTGLLLRGLMRSQAAEPGFDTRNVFLVIEDSGDMAQNAALQGRLAARLQTMPGIRNAALGSFPMMGTWTPPLLVEGSLGRTLASYASDAYLNTLGIAMLRGRNFTAREVSQGAPIAIISEATARRFWPRGDPLGKQLNLDLNFQGKFSKFEVVGIVRDVRFASLSRMDTGHVYLPAAPGDFQGVLFRSHGDAQTAIASARAAVREVDENQLPGLTIASIEDGPLRVQKSLAQTYMVYAAILTLLALTLAAVGIYGVMAYLVNQRAPEIGIRMALGATPATVLTTVVVEGLRPVFVGVALGIAGAAGLSWVLHTTLVFPGSTDFFYGIPFYDPATFLGVSCFLIFVAGVASLVPARRALRVDPMVSLRHE